MALGKRGEGGLLAISGGARPSFYSGCLQRCRRHEADAQHAHLQHAHNLNSGQKNLLAASTLVSHIT